MKWLGALAVLLFAGLSLAALSRREGRQADGAGLDPLGIRFVDINEVVTSYEKAKKDQESMQKAFLPQVAELQRREEELGKKKRELAPLDRGSEEYYQKGVELEIEQLKFKRDGDKLLAEREKKRVQLLLAAYEDIRAAVKKYAEANGLRAVFVVQKDLKDAAEEDLKEKSLKATWRQVLYYEPSLDVTVQIVKILNAQ